MSKLLRAGIVGYGYMGRIRQKNIDDHSEMELIGICDPFCKEAIEKQREVKLGNKNPAWLGGINNNPYSEDFNHQFKNLILGFKLQKVR
jgi:hypothetical protein